VTEKTDVRETREFFLNVPEKLDDPLPDLAYFRKNKPVFYHEALGQWFVFRHEDVSKLFSDPRMSADRMKGFVDAAPEEVSESFVRYATAAEEAAPLDIRYEHASAAGLPFEDAGFDFAVAFMSLTGMPEVERVLAEVYRAVRPGGFLQFTIVEHQCFATPHRETLRDEHGWAYAREVGGYFRVGDGEVQEWIFSSAPPEAREELRSFRVPRFARTLNRSEPADRGRVRARTVRRAVPGRRGCAATPRAAGRPSVRLLFCTSWRADRPRFPTRTPPLRAPGGPSARSGPRTQRPADRRSRKAPGLRVPPPESRRVCGRLRGQA
jgi:SAM-dependent methyltransferase